MLGHLARKAVEEERGPMEASARVIQSSIKGADARQYISCYRSSRYTDPYTDPYTPDLCDISLLL